MNYNETQKPDTQPGSYYVSARDADQTWLMLGPFEDNHAGALAAVDEVRKFCTKHHDRAIWYSWGTVRLPSGSKTLGNANRHLGHLLAASSDGRKYSPEFSCVPIQNGES